MDKSAKVLLILLFGVLCALVSVAWLASGFVMTTDSMEPKLKRGDVIFVTRIGMTGVTPKRSALMLIQVPDQEGQIVRRVIGLPGDIVEIDNNEVSIDGQKLDEPYLFTGTEKLEVPLPVSFGPVTVPEGFYFFLADDRAEGKDSREFGYVPRDRLVGKVITLFGYPIAL
jgi:signal peptidase I